MKKLQLWSLPVVSALLLLALGAIGAQLPAESVKAEAGGLCLPLPIDPQTLSYRTYLPVIQGHGGTPAPETCTVSEREPNEVHTAAQPIDQCVKGAAPDDLDQDWFKLEVCQGPVDLTLKLEGQGDVDLYLHSNPPGQPIARSETVGSREQIQATHLVTGTYYVLVQPAIGATGTYTLTAKAAWSGNR